MILYAWTALSGNASDAVVGMGITSSRDKARMHAEEAVASGRASMAVIEIVRPVMAAHSLSPCYLSAGAAWLGRRDDDSGGVTWRRFFVTEDDTDRIDL